MMSMILADFNVFGAWGTCHKINKLHKKIIVSETPILYNKRLFSH